MVLKIIGVLVALFVLFLAFGAMVGPPKDSPQAREECAKAIASSIGVRQPMSYADKQAYDAHVADKCQGFNIPKR